MLYVRKELSEPHAWGMSLKRQVQERPMGAQRGHHTLANAVLSPPITVPPQMKNLSRALALAAYRQLNPLDTKTNWQGSESLDAGALRLN